MAKTTTPVSEKRGGSNPGGCLVLFGLVFFLAGLVPFFLMVVKPLIQIQAAKGWTPTRCVVTSSQVTSSRDSDGDTTYRVDIEYSFQFNGREYIGNTYQFGAASSSNASGKQSIVALYPGGAQTTCYVNPTNPNESVLILGPSRDLWAGLATLIFVLAGAGIIYAGMRMRRSEHTPRSAQSWRPRGTAGPVAAGRANDLADRATAPIPQMPSGPVTLKPRTTRAAAFFFLLVFGLIWNGIVGAGLLSMTRQSGGIGVFMGLFMIPFVLVGIGVMAATVYQFIAMFGPKVKLTVSQAAVPIGGALSVKWKISGRQNVRNLKVFLEGREEATYRRGTDTYTDRNTFFVLDIVDVMSGITEGNAAVNVPSNTMHSFEAANNKITWQLVVKGEIPIWPDVKEEYPLVVLPLG